jgi:predicted nuclease of predicted toxin-antitoxin system
MKILANENIPHLSVLHLRELGYDVLSIGESNPSILDSEVMKIAISEDRIIITFDRDYGELIFKNNYKPEQGVIFLRFNEYAPEEPGVFVGNLLRNDKLKLQRALTVVDQYGIRQRKY